MEMENEESIDINDLKIEDEILTNELNMLRNEVNTETEVRLLADVGYLQNKLRDIYSVIDLMNAVIEKDNEMIKEISDSVEEDFFYKQEKIKLLRERYMTLVEEGVAMTNMGTNSGIHHKVMDFESKKRQKTELLSNYHHKEFVQQLEIDDYYDLFISEYKCCQKKARASQRLVSYEQRVTNSTNDEDELSIIHAKPKEKPIRPAQYVKPFSQLNKITSNPVNEPKKLLQSQSMISISPTKQHAPRRRATIIGPPKGYDISLLNDGDISPLAYPINEPLE